MRLAHKFAMALVVTLGSAASAFAQSGPVATACKDDIAKYCSGKEHGQGEVRACLEASKDKVRPRAGKPLKRPDPGVRG